MATSSVRDLKKDRGDFLHLVVEKPGNFDYIPGQYAAFGGKFYALASHPGESYLMFLFRGEGPVTPLDISVPMGKGFGVDFSLPGSFLFLTHGTGISAIRPAMIERKRLAFKNDTLLYGAVAEHREPELDCLESGFGVRQLRAFSEDKKRVQDELRSYDLGGTAAVLLVGSKEMMTSCREILGERGFSLEKIFSNY